jgi:hypothetical protein
MLNKDATPQNCLFTFRNLIFFKTGRRNKQQFYHRTYSECYLQGFVLRAVHVGFVVGTAAKGKGFCPVDINSALL